MNPKIAEAVNEQINIEFGSAYLYLAVSAALDALAMPGAAHWMRVQTQEELNHAMIFMRYLIDRDEKVSFPAVKVAAPKIKCMADAFNAAGEHEKFVTNSINRLAALADSEKDFMFMNFLRFFFTEQLEEEKNTKAVTDRLKLAGDSHNAMLFIDAELATRPEAAPNPTGAMPAAAGPGA
ncbi:MAG: ferritin [Victivallaceae bacterium]|nr:ferritin [Victivallaceae bacterium]